MSTGWQGLTRDETGESWHLLAQGGVISKHGYVDPGSGVPVRKVVPLLRTLVGVAIPIGVLSGVGGRTHSLAIVVLQLLVCREQA